MRKAKAARLLFAVLISLFAVTLLASGQVRPPVYSNSSLKGSYSFLANHSLTDPTQTPEAQLGSMTLDGLGNLTLSFTDNSGGVVTTWTGTGTYSLSKKGTGTMNLSVVGGGNSTFFISASTAGKAFQFLQTTCNSCGTSVVSGTAVAAGATSFTNASVKGTFEWRTTKETSSLNPNAEVTLGTATFDGISKITLSSTLDDAGVITNQTASGTYSVTTAGTGSFTVTDNLGNSSTVAFVLNSASKGAQFMETATSGGDFTNAVFTGTATKQ